MLSAWNFSWTMMTDTWNRCSDITMAMATRGWDGVTWLTEWIWDKVASLAAGIWNGVSWTIERVWNGVTWLGNRVWNGVTWTADGVWNGVTWQADWVWLRDIYSIYATGKRATYRTNHSKPK